MKEKWIMAVYMSMLVPTVFLAGCSETTASAAETTAVESEAAQEDADETDSDEADSEEADSEEATGNTDGQKPEPGKPDGTFVQVTDVTGNTISGDIVELAMPEKPDGEQPPEEKDGGTPPEKPDGEQPPETKDGGTPPEKPDGEMQPPQDGEAPEVSATGESVQFTVTDETVITLDEHGETSDGTIDDITTDLLLEVTLDDSNQAIRITIRK